MYVEADIEGHGTMGKKGSISGSIIFQTFLNLILLIAKSPYYLDNIILEECSDFPQSDEDDGAGEDDSEGLDLVGEVVRLSTVRAVGKHQQQQVTLLFCQRCQHLM